MKSPITTHVLDNSNGQPAEGVEVLLEICGETGEWNELSRGRTDVDGRVSDLLRPGQLIQGVYRLTFQVGSYFRTRRLTTFYPYVAVVFQVDNPARHYHVPLLLSPFGYSTYRGS